MEVKEILKDNGHYDFLTIIDGHAYQMINPSGLVMRDNKLIIRWIDGEYIGQDGTNYGWDSFENVINLWIETHGE